jgi:hypothetical protein
VNVGRVKISLIFAHRLERTGRLTAKKMNNLTAQIKTKSNFRNLNGQWLKVVEMVGTTVSCRAEIDGKMQTVAFALNEIEKFNSRN